MGFLSKLLGAREPAPVAALLPTPGKPIDIIPIPGELSVRVHAHGLPGIEGAFITLVSDGLAARGQREILLTLRTREGDDLDKQVEDVASFFGFIYGLAGEGKIVDAGGFTQFGPRGLLGGSHNGLVYAEAGSLPEVELPRKALAALLFGPEEVALVRAGCTYRLLARLGEHYRSFPFPLWNDLQRPSLADADEATVSVLSGVQRARTSGVSVLADAGHLRILVAPRGRAALRELLASRPDGAFALLTDPASAANAWLVWRPGQTEPAAIAPPGSDGSRVSGFFVLLCGGVERDEVRMVEDGYSLLLGPKSLASFWKALENETPFALSDCEGMSCALEWTSDRYDNPVDGRTYVAAQGWSEHRPSTPGANGRQRIILLSSDDEIDAAVTAKDLATYISGIFEELAELRQAETARRTVYVQCTLDTDEVPEIATKSEPSAPLAVDLLRRIEAVPAPAVRGKIAFQLVLELGSES